MRLGIMQPYFFPYVGYFQLISAVDEFVIYDDIEYTKKGWINRNRILVNGAPAYITLPLANGPDSAFVSERRLADSWPVERKKILNRIEAAYRKAPEFGSVFPLVEQCLNSSETNLFRFLHEVLTRVLGFLAIDTKIHVSSRIDFDNQLRSEAKVIAIANALAATDYLNPSGGRDLYSRENFAEHGINLQFIQANEIAYPQFDDKFVPNLSIIDVMMFNPLTRVRDYLHEFRLT